MTTRTGIVFVLFLLATYFIRLPLAQAQIAVQFVGECKSLTLLDEKQDTCDNRYTAESFRDSTQTFTFYATHQGRTSSFTFEGGIAIDPGTDAGITRVPIERIQFHIAETGKVVTTPTVGECSFPASGEARPIICSVMTKAGVCAVSFKTDHALPINPDFQTNAPTASEPPAEKAWRNSLHDHFGEPEEP